MPVQNTMKTPSFLKDNVLLIVATLFLSTCGYIFHFIAGRELGPADYGLVMSLLSIIYIVNIFLQALQSIIATKISEAKTQKDNLKLIGLLKLFLYKNILWAVFFSLIFIAITPFLAWLLNTTNYSVILILIILIFGAFMLPIVRGYFQGEQKFGQLSITYITEAIAKLGSLVLLLTLYKGVVSAMLS
ncbi:MAG: oligosaccharide flippase family protein, partial [Nanoarchaeota archaeon]